MKNANNMHCLFLLLHLGLLPVGLAAQLILRVTGLPGSTPAGAELYVAGTLNDWQPGLAQYRLQQDGQNNYFIALPIQPGMVQFKFTRGGWETVEIKADKSDLPNRSIDYRGGLQVDSITIEGWKDIDGQIIDKHLLDGSWVTYKYERSGEVHLEFFDGKVMWKWLDNSNPQEAARDAKLTDQEKSGGIAYRSQKIGEQLYVVNWYDKPSGTYVTLTLNFKERQMCGSAILDAKEENTATIFDSGVIEAYELKQ